MIPTIRELNSVSPDNDEGLHRMIQQEREQHGPNWNFRYIQPHTYGTDIGTLEIAHISGEEYVGVGWSEVYKWPENAYMGRRHETDDRHVEEVQCSTAPLCGLYSGQKGLPGNSM